MIKSRRPLLWGLSSYARKAHACVRGHRCNRQRPCTKQNKRQKREAKARSSAHQASTHDHLLPMGAARHAISQACARPPAGQAPLPCRHAGCNTCDQAAPAGSGRPDTKDDAAAGREVDVCCEARMRADIMVSAASSHLTVQHTVQFLRGRGARAERNSGRQYVANLLYHAVDSKRAGWSQAPTQFSSQVA